MSIQRFPSEFKEEAVRQIVERRYSVADVSARLGVSAHSLYKWVKAIAKRTTSIAITVSAVLAISPAKTLSAT